MVTFNKKNNFYLCVNNFDVKYFCKDDADHILNYLGNHYAVSTDWEDSNYPGFTITWNYKEGYIDIPMTEYVAK